MTVNKLKSWERKWISLRNLLKQISVDFKLNNLISRNEMSDIQVVLKFWMIS